jgi:predicted phage terminase large subunit-like protein
LRRHPNKTVAYVTYADRLTKSKSRFARRYAQLAGLTFTGSQGGAQTLNEWRTPEGGGALFTSIGGALTGQGCDLLIVDDPHKDRAEAESLIMREAVYDWYRGTAATRVEPGGSIVVCHTRWHPDDLIGRLLKEPNAGTWERIFLPALSEGGVALWPTRWPAEELLRRKEEIGEYEWASLFLGEPRPRGGAVFQDVHFFEEPPTADFRIGVGLDLAYTQKTSADYSVLVVLAECAGRYYVLDIHRGQLTPPLFAGNMRQVNTSYPGARWLWHTSTTEQGLADLLREECGFPLVPEIAKGDPFVRSQPVAAAWNAGKVLVQRGARWAPAFVSELASFTGVRDRHDDQVVALASAYDVLTRGHLGAGKPKVLAGVQAQGFEDYGNPYFQPPAPTRGPGVRGRFDR